jgi:hypothetical protein
MVDVGNGLFASFRSPAGRFWSIPDPLDAIGSNSGLVELGQVYRDADVEATNRESVVADL